MREVEKRKGWKSVGEEGEKGVKGYKMAEIRTYL